MVRKIMKWGENDHNKSLQHHKGPLLKYFLGRIARAIKIVLVLGIALSLSSCGPLFTLYANHEGWDCEAPNQSNLPQECEERKKDRNTVSPLKDDEMANTLAEKFGLMALFAQLAYRQDLKKSGTLDTACDSRANPTFGIPIHSVTGGKWIRLNDANLKKWSQVKIPNTYACVNDESGLFYETYIFINATGIIEEAVIAFRGTEDSIDWITNLSAIFGIQPKQYEQASNYLPNLIESLKNLNPDDKPKPKVYAVGHSLGGGLAQQAGYQFKEIHKVFTFNSSPVTNWTWLRFRGLVKQEYPIIYRINHGGEFLEKIRFITTSFTSTRYRRYDVGIQFQPRAVFKGHSMKIFTCSFAALIASVPDKGDMTTDAAHFYGRKDALNLFPNDKEDEVTKLCECDYLNMVKETNIGLINVH
ncbi:MAG: DUF2974 domain-containing protein [Nitrospirales bacterium]|nr:DUF2974 domain-containing protein [Nitrospira sp.]MDR4460698.1 DUF2974 domain-containing protein [Nitrospirales bacterium]MDR4481831.1 DUF2974 domain-containing protein [Nitrospirales bacterium]